MCRLAARISGRVRESGGLKERLIDGDGEMMLFWFLRDDNGPCGSNRNCGPRGAEDVPRNGRGGKRREKRRRGEKKGGPGA